MTIAHSGEERPFPLDDVAPLKCVYQGAESSSLGVIVEMSRTH